MRALRAILVVAILADATIASADPPITDQDTRAYALVERSPAEPSLRLRLVERLLEAGRVDEAATEVGMLAA
ncbi:MAG: hypothetical protein AB7P00_32095, partial [Sandaracinaceae bacterium]